MGNYITKYFRSIAIVCLSLLFREYADAYVSMIRPERVWIYESFGGYLDGMDYLKVRHSLKIGDEREYRGKIYHEVILFHTAKIKSTIDYSLPNDQYPEELVDEYDSFDVLSFIREEDGIVYRLDKRIMANLDEGNSNPNIGEIEELLYNWNLCDGDVWFKEQENFEGALRVKYKEPVMIGNDICRVMEFSFGRISFIEGIGAICKGDLEGYEIYDCAHLEPSIGLERPSGDAILWEVYDNGERVYACEQAASVEKISISYSNPESFEKLFDLHGCPISNPLPGTVYIRDGKKYVSR